jgi:hypothetical protein
MKRIIWQATIMVLLAVRLPAQPSLEFFTNQANALLLPQFGFGVEHIPIYSSTNPAIAYSAPLHYLLQSAANAYDATTPATNSPSVFRPLFAWSSNALFIVGYTNVTTDFYAQMGGGFKVLTNPTISSNDNVWGIPWVVGAKGSPPAFNEYCYSTAVIAARKLLFVRYGTEEAPITNLPPKYTNQFFMMSISNVFGVEAWNYSHSNFPDGVTIVASNQITISITNNYNGGTNLAVSAGTNWIINSWPGWTGGHSDASFLVPIFTNVIPLPPAYWSESTGQFVQFENGIVASNSFLASDLQQIGWPVHNWTLNITNNFTYGLIDNRTGLVLDFVNLGCFGSSLPITQLLPTGQGGLGSTNDEGLEWATNGATDAPNSPMSSGVLEQILIGQQESSQFAAALNGMPSSIPSWTFGAPSEPDNEIEQNCSWQSANPLVHYALDDLAGSENEEATVYAGYPIPSLGSQISGSVCTLGSINRSYNSGAVENISLGLTSDMFQLNFSGIKDLPYTIWASMNLLDWSQIGIASQSEAGSFQFNDPAATNYSERYYQVRLP